MAVATRSDGAEQEAALVRRAQRGDLQAREQLARQLRPHLLRLCYQLLGSREDAQDLAQESLLRFFSTLERFQPGRPVLPWLRRIARNGAIDLVRRGKVRQADSLDSDGVEGGPIEVAGGQPTPEITSQQRQLRRQIWRCLHRLSPAHREILVLRDYQDLSYKEIAETLEVPIGTVMSRLHGARKALREEIVTSGLQILDLDGAAREDRSRRKTP